MKAILAALLLVAAACAPEAAPGGREEYQAWWASSGGDPDTYAILEEISLEACDRLEGGETAAGLADWLRSERGEQRPALAYAVGIGVGYLCPDLARGLQ